MRKEKQLCSSLFVKQKSPNPITSIPMIMSNDFRFSLADASMQNAQSPVGSFR